MCILCEQIRLHGDLHGSRICSIVGFLDLVLIFEESGIISKQRRCLNSKHIPFKSWLMLLISYTCISIYALKECKKKFTLRHYLKQNWFTTRGLIEYLQYANISWSVFYFLYWISSYLEFCFHFTWQFSKCIPSKFENKSLRETPSDPGCRIEIDFGSHLHHHLYFASLKLTQADIFCFM